MDKDCTTILNSISHESNAFHKVSIKILPWYIHYLKYFIFEMFWEWWGHASKRLQNMCYTFAFHTEQIIGSSDVTQVYIIYDFINMRHNSLCNKNLTYKL